MILHPFDSEWRDQAIDTIIGAWNALKVKQNFEIWKGHNSGSKAFPDVFPQPFDSEWRDLAIDTTIGAWNDLKVTQKIETKFETKFENAIFEKYPYNSYFRYSQIFSHLDGRANAYINVSRLGLGAELWKKIVRKNSKLLKSGIHSGGAMVLLGLFKGSTWKQKLLS